jgi:hypothetical protein
MRIEQNPIHRKAIIPWYDSGPACVMIIIGMLVVFLFSLAGIAVSHETPEWSGYGWVAALLAALSGWVVVSTGFRLIRRHPGRS